MQRHDRTTTSGRRQASSTGRAEGRSRRAKQGWCVLYELRPLGSAHWRLASSSAPAGVRWSPPLVGELMLLRQQGPAIRAAACDRAHTAAGSCPNRSPPAAALLHAQPCSGPATPCSCPLAAPSPSLVPHDGDAGNGLLLGPGLAHDAGLHDTHKGREEGAAREVAREASGPCTPAKQPIQQSQQRTSVPRKFMSAM